MNADIALQLLVAALNNASKIGALIQNARAQGRDVSDYELDSLRKEDDAARTALNAEIARQIG